MTGPGNSLDIQYDLLGPSLKQLEAEAKYILQPELEASHIKLSGVESTIRDKEALLQECADRNVSDIENEVHDLVSVCIITLFKSDVPRIERIVMDAFEAEKIEQDRMSAPEALGYVSARYKCRMKKIYRGPRYDVISGRVFEVQIRTLCMHAWASVAQHLDYRTENDIPPELKKEMNALSGLFFVADGQFESVYRQRIATREMAMQRAGTPEAKARALSFDTVAAELARLYPDRDQCSPRALSLFLSEISAAGMATVEELLAVLEPIRPIALEFEERNPPPSARGQFTDVGLARISLEIASEEFSRQSKGRTNGSAVSLNKYREMYRKGERLAQSPTQ